MFVIEKFCIHGLRWPGHVPGVSDDHIEPRLPNPPVSRRGPPLTRQRNMKSLTEGLSRIGNVRLVGWGLLETLSDMTSSRSQWHSSTFSLALLS